MRVVHHSRLAPIRSLVALRLRVVVGAEYIPKQGQLLVVLVVGPVLALQAVKVQRMAREILHLFLQVRVIEEERQNILLALARVPVEAVAQPQLAAVVRLVFRLQAALAVLERHLVFLAAASLMPVAVAAVETLVVDQLLAPVVRVVAGMVVQQIHLLPLPLARPTQEEGAAVSPHHQAELLAPAALAS